MYQWWLDFHSKKNSCGTAQVNFILNWFDNLKRISTIKILKDQKINKNLPSQIYLILTFIFNS